MDWLLGHANATSSWIASSNTTTFEALQDPLSVCGDWVASIRVVAWMALGMFLVYHPMMLMCASRIRSAPWWAKSLSAQRAVIAHFGFTGVVPEWDLYTVS